MLTSEHRKEKKKVKSKKEMKKCLIEQAHIPVSKFRVVEAPPWLLDLVNKRKSVVMLNVGELQVRCTCSSGDKKNKKKRLVVNYHSI